MHLTVSGRSSFLKQFLIYLFGKIIIFFTDHFCFLFVGCLQLELVLVVFIYFFAFDQSARQSHGERTVKKQTRGDSKAITVLLLFVSGSFIISA